MSARAVMLAVLSGCGVGYPEMAGEWYGLCEAGGEQFPFEVFRINEYQGAGYVNGALGEHVVYSHSGRVLHDGEWVNASAQSIYCLDEAGCALDADQLADVSVDFVRMELTWLASDGSASHRLVADGVREEPRAISGNCWQSVNGQWGTFTAERVQGPWVDGYETEQSHPGSE